MAGLVSALHDFACFSTASRGWPGQAGHDTVATGAAILTPMRTSRAMTGRRRGRCVSTKPRLAVVPSLKRIDRRRGMDALSRPNALPLVILHQKRAPETAPASPADLPHLSSTAVRRPPVLDQPQGGIPHH